MHSASEWYHGRPSLPVRSTGRSSDNGSPQAPKSQPVWRARRFSGTTLGATEQTAQRRPKATQRRSDRKPCLEAESKFDLPELVSRASLRAPIDASLRKAQGTSGCSIVEEAAAAPWLFQWLGYSEYSHRATSVRCSSMALPMRWGTRSTHTGPLPSAAAPWLFQCGRTLPPVAFHVDSKRMRTCAQC